MNCPHCDAEVSEGTTCPKCGSTWSEDRFNSSPEIRTDTQYRLVLGGHQVATSRLDLKSFMAALCLMIAVQVVIMILALLEGRDQLAKYLGVTALSAVAVVIILRARGAQLKKSALRTVLLLTLVLLVAGIATVIVGEYLLYEVSVSNYGGSIRSFFDTTDECVEWCEGVVHAGWLLGAAAAAAGLAIIAVKQLERTQASS